MLIAEAASSLAGTGEEAFVESGWKAETGCQSANEHDNSQADATDDAQSKNNDKPAAMVCFQCIGS
jgi:hypothetical protein